MSYVIELLALFKGNYIINSYTGSFKKLISFCWPSITSKMRNKCDNIKLKTSMIKQYKSFTVEFEKNIFKCFKSLLYLYNNLIQIIRYL